MTDLNSLPVHAFIYGPPGTRKTSLAATFPAPIEVANFDAPTKVRPYLDRGLDRGGRFEASKDDRGNPCTTVYGASGRSIITIHHFQDVLPAEPTAWPRFDAWLTTLTLSGKLPATIVIDTVDAMAFCVRKRDEYADNQGDWRTKKALQWHGAAHRALEELLYGRLPALPCHLAVLCHVEEDKDERDGIFVRNPLLPKSLRQGVSGKFEEFWRTYTSPGPTGPLWRVQTVNRDGYFANTACRAPDGAAPDFNTLTGRKTGFNP